MAYGLGVSAFSDPFPFAHRVAGSQARRVHHAQSTLNLNPKPRTLTLNPTSRRSLRKASGFFDFFLIEETHPVLGHFGKRRIV